DTIRRVLESHDAIDQRPELTVLLADIVQSHRSITNGLPPSRHRVEPGNARNIEFLHALPDTPPTQRFGRIHRLRQEYFHLIGDRVRLPRELFEEPVVKCLTGFDAVVLAIISNAVSRDDKAHLRKTVDRPEQQDGRENQ